MKSIMTLSLSFILNLFPSLIFNLLLYFLKSFTLPLIPVLPDVQNGIIVLLVKSYVSNSVNIILGFVPHQMGYPKYTVSYLLISILFFISGLALLSFCSLLARQSLL